MNEAVLGSLDLDTLGFILIFLVLCLGRDVDSDESLGNNLSNIPSDIHIRSARYPPNPHGVTGDDNAEAQSRYGGPSGPIIRLGNCATATTLSCL
jgi:hypothetical protein